MKRWPLVLALVMMGTTWAFLSSRARAEPSLPRDSFATYPLRLGSFVGRDIPMDDDVLKLLNLTDYVMRAYVPAQDEHGDADAFETETRQAEAPVSFYVGYYGSQRTGATYHSPKNCLPGGGWVFQSSELVRGVIPGRPKAAINRVVIEKGLAREMILYWYQDRGRVVASEYKAKGYLIWDAMTKNRTDGSLVRISTPIVGSEDDAFQHVVAFLQVAWEPLTHRLPG